MKIYVATSWKNEHHASVVAALRADGHTVYDFKVAGAAFDWKQISPDFESWTAEQTIEAYGHELARLGLMCDFKAMTDCDALVAVQPYGCDASLELGWAVGAKRPTCVLMSSLQKPGLMTRLADYLTVSLDDVVIWARGLDQEMGNR